MLSFIENRPNVKVPNGSFLDWLKAQPRTSLVIRAASQDALEENVPAALRMHLGLLVSNSPTNGAGAGRSTGIRLTPPE